MKLQQAFVASALLALGISLAAPVRGADAASLENYVKIAQKVFNGENTSAEVVSELVAKDGGAKAGEIAATLSAAEVAKEADESALADIVEAFEAADSDLAEKAAATVAAVTGTEGLSDDPEAVLGDEAEALKDLYEKVLEALAGGGYEMQEDGDRVGLEPAPVPGDEDGEAGFGDDAGADADTIGGGDTDSDTDTGSDTVGGDDVYTVGGDDTDGEIPDGDPTDQTQDNPHEYHATPTTLSGSGPMYPLVTPTTTPTATPSKKKPSKPSSPTTTKPSPTPVGLR